MKQLRPCARCKLVPIRGPGQAYCLPCANAYDRERRPKRPMSAERHARHLARSRANVAQKSGRLKPRPCEVCGKAEVEKHHDDYDKPFEVRWLCRKHHRQLHQENQ